MSDEESLHSEEVEVTEALVRTRRGVSVVWLVPIFAAVIAGGLWLQALRASGPLVTVVFDDGSSLEAGKTKVQYDGVEVGRIETVNLSADLATVITTIQLDSSAARMAQEGAEYWVVRPTIGIGGVSGLETLVSGSYIGVVPGRGSDKRSFTGVGQPPMSATRIPGLQLHLTSKSLASLEVGSPVAFRQIQVGEITGYVLREDRSGVDLTLVVYDRHKHLVREESRFYNASGVDVTLGGSGLKVETQSVAAMLLGGVSFLTPTGDSAGSAVADGAQFVLHSDLAAVRRERRIRMGLTIILESAALGSIKKGDPVSYREVEVGEVLKAALAAESANVLVHVNIWPKYTALVRENSVFWNASGVKAHFGLFSGLDLSMESLESLIAGGVAFATPDEPGPRVANGASFRIATKSEDNWLSWAPKIGRVVDTVIRAPVRAVKKSVEVMDPGKGEASMPEVAAEPAPDGEPVPQAHTPQRHGGRHRGL